MDRSAPLQQLVQAQHSRLRELAARSQDPNIDEFERRRNMDQFAAAAAQHAAAVADVLLTASPVRTPRPFSTISTVRAGAAGTQGQGVR